MTGRTNSGLTTIEILIVMTVVSIIALAAVPVAEISYVKTQEDALRYNLQLIRTAIIRWKQDCRSALIRQSGVDSYFIPDSKLYPESLMQLVNPPQMITITWQDYYGNDIFADFYPRQYLQTLPQDPFIGRPYWDIHYASGSQIGLFDGQENHPADHAGIFDVSPHPDSSTRRGFVRAIDGTLYKDW